jgi:hypothetical protein
MVGDAGGQSGNLGLGRGRVGRLSVRDDQRHRHFTRPV